MLGEKEKLSVAFLKIAKMLLFKFDHLMAAVAGNIDILLITETNIDSIFPVNQFYLNGYNIP